MHFIQVDTPNGPGFIETRHICAVLPTEKGCDIHLVDGTRLHFKSAAADATKKLIDTYTADIQAAAKQANEHLQAIELATKGRRSGDFN